MQMIRTIIRPEKTTEVLSELLSAGFPAVTKLDVVGRGKQKGIMTGEYKMYPDGGTTVEEIRALGTCRKVLALGRLTSEEPAAQLKRKCGVDFDLLPLPIGLADTDAFVMRESR